jgi:hypothetical protein
MSDDITSPVRMAGGGEPWTVRVAMWSASHRWIAVALWFVFTLGLLGLSIAAGGIKPLDVNQDPNEARLESQHAYDVYNAGKTTAASERLVVVIAGQPGAASDAAFRSGVTTLVANLAGATATIDGATAKSFDQVANPFLAPPTADLVSPDGSAVRIIADVPGERERV